MNDSNFSTSHAKCHLSCHSGISTFRSKVPQVLELSFSSEQHKRGVAQKLSCISRQSTGTHALFDIFHFHNNLIGKLVNLSTSKVNLNVVDFMLAS